MRGSLSPLPAPSDWNPLVSVADMRPEHYRVVPIPPRLDNRENRGTRTKFWVRIGEGSDRWLFKIPRPNNGEHWAEKVAAEIGRLFGIECASVELARYVDEAKLERGVCEVGEEPHVQQPAPHRLGTICKSFIPDTYPEDMEYYYFHGWEVMQSVVENYDSRIRFGQRDHNVKNITLALTDLMGVNTLNPMPRWDYILEKLASYVLLDGPHRQHGSAP